MSRLPSLLFVTPILPARTGNGLAMRAGWLAIVGVGLLALREDIVGLV